MTNKKLFGTTGEKLFGMATKGMATKGMATKIVCLNTLFYKA